MILAFSKLEFEKRIKSGIKIHTIRKDIHNRWKPGMQIHFYMHNPRNVKLNPYLFGVGFVSIIRWITIDATKDEVRIDGDLLSPLEKEMLSKADGFDSFEQMKEWFNEPFIGRLIYWNNYQSV